MAVPQIIDFSPYLADKGAVIGQPATPEQAEVAKQLNEVNRGTGFAYLVNIGISAEDLEAWFKASKELFMLPQEQKRALQQLEPQQNVGYSPVGQENLNLSRPADLKESFNIRDGHTDFKGCPKLFAEAAEDLWKKADFCMHRYGVACAVALGLEYDFFTSKLHEKDQVTVRFLHYPPCDFNPESIESHGPIRIGEHTDFGLFTLLFMDGPADGLEVKKVAGGEVDGAGGGEAGGWTAVNGLGGASLVVNTGALFARWTNDVWRATAHRVVVPSASAAASSRYTIACFCDPDKKAPVVVDPRFLAPGDTEKYPPITAGDYVLDKLMSTQRRPSQNHATDQMVYSD